MRDWAAGQIAALQNGDDQMTFPGFDCASRTDQALPAAVSAGFRWIGRYYSHNAAKNLAPAEAKLILASGLQIVSIWEARGDDPGSFSAQQGARDGHDAAVLAQQCGQPSGSAIFFAVDFDATEGQLGAIRAYFAAAGGMIAGLYSCAVYGSGNVCETLLDSKLVVAAGLAGAKGWRGYADFDASGRWGWKQGKEEHLASLGLNVDLGEIKEDASAACCWGPIEGAAPAPDRSVLQPPAARMLALGSSGVDVAELQTGLKTLGAFEPTGGQFDAMTHLALATWQTSVGLVPDGIFGPISRAHLAEALAKRGSVV